MPVRTIIIAILAGLLASGPAFAQTTGIQGVWVTHTGNAEVQIARCGTAFCGTVTKVMANRAMASASESKAPPLKVGQKIISDIVPDQDHWRGHIYNREDGSTYDCLLSVDRGGAALKLRVYRLFPIFGKDLVWPRAAD